MFVRERGSHKTMKKTLLLFALVLAVPYAALAQSEGLPPCISGVSLAYYVTNFQNGCVIGDKVFSGFSGSSTVIGEGLGVATPNSSIIVGVDPTGFNPGLTFQGGWNATNGQVNDTLIQYTVTVMEGGNPIEDASLGLWGSGTVGFSGVKIDETLCLGGSFGALGCSSGDTDSLHVLDAPFDNPDVLFDHITFTPVMTVDVIKDIQLSAAGTGDFNWATLSLVTQNFSETPVPEPATLSLLGTGLIMLGGAVRRRLKSKS